MPHEESTWPQCRHVNFAHDLILGAFVRVLLYANLIDPAKITEVHGIDFGAGVLFFPISYLFGDILTEVYGYARSRRAIWSGWRRWYSPRS